MNDAMVAGDELAEAEIRYKLLAEVFHDSPQLRGNINSQLERAKAEIIRLRAAKAADKKVPAKLVRIDPNRFRKSDSGEGA